MGQAQVFPEEDYSVVPHITSSTGRKLHTRSWLPGNGEIRALWYICHGVAEHIERYDDFAKTLTDGGIAVFGHSHVGHGRSEGDRVHIDDYAEYVADVALRLKAVRQEHPNVPLALFGHSMGGLIALLTAIEHKDLVDFLALSAPALMANPEVATPFKVMLLKTVPIWIAPHIELGNLPEDYLCHDKAVMEMFAQDPYRWQAGMKLGWAAATLSAQEKAASLHSSLDTPILIYHGTEDRYCMIDGSHRLYSEIASEDKTMKDIEGGYHKLDYEPDGVGEQVRQLCVTWLTERL